MQADPRSKVVVITDPKELPIMLNVRLAAQVSGYGQARIRELCRARKAPHVRLGRAYMLPRDTFLAWLENEAARNCG